MANNLALLPDPDPLRAVTVSRDVQEFDLLIEDMEADLGEAWGDLDFAEALAFLQQEESAKLEFIVLAIDQEDAHRVPQVIEIIGHAKKAGLRTILVAEGLGPTELHELMRAGADDFVPYPLPEGALTDSIARIRSPEFSADHGVEAQAGSVVNADGTMSATATGGGGGVEGALFAIQSAAGGGGASTIAVNLAWELANISKTGAPSVCIVDLGLQFGSIATYLDLPRKAMIYEVLTDVDNMDKQAFLQALTGYKDKLQVFTAPADMLPLDIVSPDDVTALLTLARKSFDVVIVDMPCALTGWTDTVITAADIYFLVCELEMRSAQNALRFQKLLQAEGVVIDRMSFLLNRAPGKMDMTGRGRIDKMSESLGIKFHTVLSDGGKQITEVNDQAATLRELAPRNALTKDIQKLAQGIHDARQVILAGGDPSLNAKKKAIFGLKFG